ncbi:MAG: tetraacyldisaccharide 4'-kinase, partial [bacterium]
MESKERGPVHWLAQRGGVRELLCVPAALFGCVARLRAGLYERRLLSVQEVGVPVVSIGNITAGGTGKTPMVALVVRTLIAQGYQPAILSRGYGSSPGVPNDEALELARLLPKTEHVQEPRRVAGAARLVDRGADVIVMDDGFQHRHLARNLDLVLIDATRPMGLPRPQKGGEAVQAFLPRGLMREDFHALKRADFLLIT